MNTGNTPKLLFGGFSIQHEREAFPTKFPFPAIIKTIDRVSTIGNIIHFLFHFRSKEQNKPNGRINGKIAGCKIVKSFKTKMMYCSNAELMGVEFSFLNQIFKLHFWS